MFTLLNKGVKYFGKTLNSIGLAATLLVGCSPEFSLDEIVSQVSTPTEAQDFFLENITYASEDNDTSRNSDRLPMAPNYADTQSLRLTLERGKGVCRDISLAIAALLKDDGFKPLNLAVFFRDAGHSVFIYEIEGKFGSAGINESDFIPP